MISVLSVKGKRVYKARREQSKPYGDVIFRCGKCLRGVVVSMKGCFYTAGKCRVCGAHVKVKMIFQPIELPIYSMRQLQGIQIKGIENGKKR